jgi:hypothetical protein
MRSVIAFVGLARSRRTSSNRHRLPVSVCVGQPCPLRLAMLMPVSRKPATDLGILAHQFFSVIDIAEVSGRHVMEKARSLLSQLGRRDRIAEPEAEEYETAERTEP